MSEATVDEAHDDVHHHVSDLDYVKVFVGLVVLTALEVLTFYIDMPTPLLIIGLAIMMSAKFFLIVAWFMHLRDDHVMFSRLFVGGLMLAIVVYIVMLLSFQFLDGFDF